MLACPEVKSAEHILLWLASKPPRERYEWINRHNCACGQYWEENVDARHPALWCAEARRPGVSPIEMLNSVAQDCKTFGALHNAYAKAMGRRI